MPIQAILFDFMGTCLDWHSSILSSLPSTIPEALRSDFALDWRQAYFDINAQRVSQHQPPEDFDTTLHKALSATFSANKEKYAHFQDLVDPHGLVRAFHHQKAWDDVRPALEGLRAKGYEVYVHANGTTRLQLDLVRSAGLGGIFDMLFSSQLLGVIKPGRGAYEKGLELIGRRAEECVMVAAHAYDTRGAKKVGMKIIYVYRWTDDILEDQGVVEKEHDVYLGDGMRRLVEAVESLDK